MSNNINICFGLYIISGISIKHRIGNLIASIVAFADSIVSIITLGFVNTNWFCNFVLFRAFTNFLSDGNRMHKAREQ